MRKKTKTNEINLLSRCMHGIALKFEKCLKILDIIGQCYWSEEYNKLDYKRKLLEKQISENNGKKTRSRTSN